MEEGESSLGETESHPSPNVSGGTDDERILSLVVVDGRGGTSDCHGVQGNPRLVSSSITDPKPSFPW